MALKPRRRSLSCGLVYVQSRRETRDDTSDVAQHGGAADQGMIRIGRTAEKFRICDHESVDSVPSRGSENDLTSAQVNQRNHIGIIDVRYQR